MNGERADERKHPLRPLRPLRHTEFAVYFSGSYGSDLSLWSLRGSATWRDRPGLRRNPE